MAHEIAHVAARHGTRQATRGEIAQLATIPLIFMGGAAAYGIYEASGLIIPVSFLKFSRNFESEADYLGVEYMYKAGYDPNAFTTFFEKMEALEKHKPGAIAKAFSTHPQTPQRLEKTQHEINTLLPPENQYKLDTSDFENVKARLAQLENRRKVEPGPDQNRPSLRRATNKTNSDDGGRPTLKRRDDNDNFR